MSKRMEVNMLKYVFYILVSSSLFAQTNISGPAPVRFQDAGTACQGMSRVVDVFVDVTGLTGDEGPVGLNSYVLTIQLSSNVFGSAVGGSPMTTLPWATTYSENAVITANGNKVIVVGWAPDLNAPNDEVHVARLTLSGDMVNVTLSLVTGESSLGSKLTGIDMPGAVNFDPISSGDIVVAIPATFDMVHPHAYAAWQTFAALYDFQPGDGIVDIRDLSALINCQGDN